MNYYEKNKRNNEEYTERLELVMERLAEIAKAPEVQAPYDAYFKAAAGFAGDLYKAAGLILENPKAFCGEEGKKYNQIFFADQLAGDLYATSFLK